MEPVSPFFFFSGGLSEATRPPLTLVASVHPWVLPNVKNHDPVSGGEGRAGGENPRSPSDYSKTESNQIFTGAF